MKRLQYYSFPEGYPAYELDQKYSTIHILTASTVIESGMYGSSKKRKAYPPID